MNEKLREMLERTGGSGLKIWGKIHNSKNNKSAINFENNGVSSKSEISAPTQSVTYIEGIVILNVHLIKGLLNSLVYSFLFRLIMSNYNPQEGTFVLNGTIYNLNDCLKDKLIGCTLIASQSLPSHA